MTDPIEEGLNAAGHLKDKPVVLTQSEFNLIRGDLGHIRMLAQENARDLDIIKSSLPFIMKAVSDVESRVKAMETNPCPRKEVLDDLVTRIKNLEEIHPEVKK